MKTILAILSLCAVLPGQHAMAHVNDTRSHGAVGDAYLSLDEAIRLLNGQLAAAQLSPAERAMLMGSGLPTMVVIDAAMTPTVTVERALTAIDGAAARTPVHVEGHGATAAPVLLASGTTVVFQLRTNRAFVHGLTIRGGRIGLLADTTTHHETGENLELMHLTFDGQTEAGLRLEAGASATPVMLMHSAFVNQASAIVVDDRAVGNGVTCMAHDVDFDATAIALDVACDGYGLTSMCELNQAIVRAGQFLRSRRTSASSQRMMLMLRDVDVRTTGDAMDVQGNAVGDTLLHFHHSNVRPGTGARALYLWPQDGRFDVHGSENVIHGDVDISAGRFTRRVWTWNTIFRDGTIAIANQGSRPSLRWNRFERCTIRATTANRTQLPLLSSEFWSCSIDGQATSAAIVLDNCWLAQTSTTGAVEVYNPAPSPWLGESWSSTATPRLGTYADLTLQLPPGMAGVWHLGLADPAPLYTEEPWRFYLYRETLLALPGVHVALSTLRLPIPPMPRLLGVTFYLQPVSVPYLGQGHVPVFNLPRGVYLTPM
jgi:hypothetical protein